jgi:hypothetical protein
VPAEACHGFDEERTILLYSYDSIAVQPPVVHEIIFPDGRTYHVGLMRREPHICILCKLQRPNRVGPVGKGAGRFYGRRRAMGEGVYSVLVVSGRLLVAQAIKGLLEAESEITSIDVAVSLYEAFDTARARPPDAIVLDLPVGSEWLIDRPITIDERVVRTIVLQQENGHSRLYVLSPSIPATPQNLRAAILQDVERRYSPAGQSGDNALADLPGYSQPINLMIASASDPKSSRISDSKTSL